MDKDKDKVKDNDNGTTMSALPEATRKGPVSLVELTRDIEYVDLTEDMVIDFEGDRGEGSGGPSHSPL